MQASIQATLYRMERASERLTIGRDTTLRAVDGHPIDVFIQDLSITGCRISTSLALEEGDDLMIGLAGVGARSCRVAWTSDREAGCEFKTPLTAAEIEETRIAETLALGRFASIPFPMPPASVQTEEGRFSTRRSLLLIIAAATAAWVALGGIAFLAYHLFAS